MRRPGRAWALAALAAATLAGAACARLPGRRRAPTPAPDSVRVAADTARPDSAAPAARGSAARADSAAVAARDSAADTTAAARARRAPEADPAARCGRITFNDPRVFPTSRVQAYGDAEGNYVSFFGGGVFVRCPAVGSTLRADSAEYYETLGQLTLIGNVVYEEPGRNRLQSLRLTYYTNDERLLAEGNVVATLPSGTTMSGPTVDYLRAVRRVRPTSRLTATGRPVVRAVGGAARRGAPRPADDTTVTIITANTIVDEADSVVFASGSVVIDRADLRATSDSATFDQLSEVARLLRQAAIVGKRGRPYTLTGTRIDLFARERQLTRVVSRDSARIVSEELNLRSDTVDLRLLEGQIDRAFAWGPSRAQATSPERDVVADSIAAVLPGQRVRELWAVRRAVARTVPDSTRIVSTERDLLRGDTIHAQFDTVPAAPTDTGRAPPVRRIRALGNASSLFQVASQRGRTAPPAINYVRGRNITVDFDSGTVQTVTVTDSATGVYLEPDSTQDSARVGPVDSIAVPTVVPVVPGAPGATPRGGRPAGTPPAAPPPTPTSPAPTAPAPPAGAPPTNRDLQPRR
jgi:lipopolysaccharide export system protein LptA